MTENFLLKYTPTSLDEFHVDNKKLFNNDVNILICGQAGSGKTTLLTQHINEYFGYHVDIHSDSNVLFMSNLKEQGIQFCRSNVKTFCQNASMNVKRKKIIAIDDVDEFNDTTQQVISNCITKYCTNVLCVATCCNTLKVYSGLKSRMAFVTLHLPPNDYLEKYSAKIIKDQNIIIEPDLIQHIVEYSNSSYKILLNNLQKFKLFNKNITYENINDLITTINNETLDNYFTNLLSCDLQSAIDSIFKVVESGISVIDILFELIAYMKISRCVIKSDTLKYKIIQIITKYITIFNNTHEDQIEIAFLTNDLISIIETHQDTSYSANADISSLLVHECSVYDINS